MKIKGGFVTNSSSTCYVLDKRHLTEEELTLIREGNETLMLPYYYGAGRSSVYGEGADVVYYLEWLKDDDAAWGRENYLARFLRDGVRKIGGENIIFVRASDEDMGGHVQHEDLIAEKAVAGMEYH